ncbi:MAG: hypothetical protein WBE98_12255 [Gammaproteobacteria bacterium]
MRNDVPSVNRVATRSLAVAAVLSLCLPTLPAGAQSKAVPDFSGIYRSGRANSPCGLEGVYERSERCPITDAALERVATVDHYDDPGLRCEADGLGRLFTRLPRPVPITQRDDEIEIFYEYFAIQRTIHLDGEPPGPDHPHTLHGYSVGRWEGDTLVVETTHLSENLFTLPTSEEARTVERYRKSERGGLYLDVVIHDPKFYDRPLALERAEFTPTPDDYIAEWECVTQEALFTEGEIDLDAFFD